MSRPARFDDPIERLITETKILNEGIARLMEVVEFDEEMGYVEESTPEECEQSMRSMVHVTADVANKVGVPTGVAAVVPEVDVLVYLWWLTIHKDRQGDYLLARYLENHGHREIYSELAYRYEQAFYLVKRFTEERLINVAARAAKQHAIDEAYRRTSDD